MPLKTVVGKLEDMWDYLSETSPDNIRTVAEMLHKTDVALFKAADFIDNLSPNAAGTANVKEEFGVSEEKLSEIKSDLEHLKEEITNEAGRAADASKAAAANALALPPGLKQLLLQLVLKAIDELLDRIGK